MDFIANQNSFVLIVCGVWLQPRTISSCIEQIRTSNTEIVNHSTLQFHHKQREQWTHWPPTEKSKLIMMSAGKCYQKIEAIKHGRTTTHHTDTNSMRAKRNKHEISPNTHVQLILSIARKISNRIGISIYRTTYVYHIWKYCGYTHIRYSNEFNWDSNTHTYNNNNKTPRTHTHTQWNLNTVNESLGCLFCPFRNFASMLADFRYSLFGFVWGEWHRLLLSNITIFAD